MRPELWKRLGTPVCATPLLRAGRRSLTRELAAAIVSRPTRDRSGESLCDQLSNGSVGLKLVPSAREISLARR